MKFVTTVSIPDNDEEFGKLVLAYNEAKKALEQYLYREGLAFSCKREKHEDAASGN